MSAAALASLRQARAWPSIGELSRHGELTIERSMERRTVLPPSCSKEARAATSLSSAEVPHHHSSRSVGSFASTCARVPSLST